jgi:hypothetical protein
MVLVTSFRPMSSVGGQCVEQQSLLQTSHQFIMRASRGPPVSLGRRARVSRVAPLKLVSARQTRDDDASLGRRGGRGRPVRACVPRVMPCRQQPRPSAQPAKKPINSRHCGWGLQLRSEVTCACFAHKAGYPLSRRIVSTQPRYAPAITGNTHASQGSQYYPQPIISSAPPYRGVVGRTPSASDLSSQVATQHHHHF